MKLTQFFNSCHENDQLLIYFFLNFRIFFALFTENNANLTPTRDDVTHPRDSWHYEPDSVWPCGISNLENLTPNPQFEGGRVVLRTNRSCCNTNATKTFPKRSQNSPTSVRCYSDDEADDEHPSCCFWSNELSCLCGKPACSCQEPNRSLLVGEKSTSIGGIASGPNL